ncbi:TetR/AcrR family transcriptional regulator [Nocardia brasiliensis]
MSNSVAKSRRLDVDARRQQIVEVAAEHFAAVGYESTSLADIARAADTSRALVYHYFAGKAALLTAVIEREAERLLVATAPDDSLPPAERLAASLHAYLDYVERSSPATSIFYTVGGGVDPTINAIVKRNLEVQARRIRESFDLLDTSAPLLDLALNSWFALIIQAAADWVQEQTTTRDQVVELCASALAAALAVVDRHHGDTKS